MEGDPTDLTPRIDTRQGAPTPILPPQLLAEIRHSFPGYRVAGDKERIREWAEAKGDELPYAAWGDFDGNDLTDVVLNLASDEKWTLGVFHQEKGKRYSSMPLLARPIRPSEQEDRLQNWSLAAVPMGTEYQVEHWDEDDDTPRTIKTLTFKTDAFQLVHRESGTTLFHWNDGSYDRIDQMYE